MQQNDQERAIAEYVQEYSVNRYTLNKAIKQNRLAARKSGGTYLVKQSDFDAWHMNHKRLPRQTNSSDDQKEVSKRLDNSTIVEYTKDSEESNELSKSRKASR